MAAIITVSITLQPDTSQHEAEQIREELIRVLNRQMNWFDQRKAVVGTSLEIS